MYAYIFNNYRRRSWSYRSRLLHWATIPLKCTLLKLGFKNVDYAYVHGDPRRVILGNNVSTTDTLFNTMSGRIIIGDDTLFAHGCMVLTGVHRFESGRRASLQGDHSRIETPTEGNDILIGKGCFIGSGAIILANVIVGDDVIVGAGSVVTTSIPACSFAAGVPAKVLKSL